MQGGLGLDGDDAGAEASEGGHAIADMGADVEDEVAPSDELRMERVHRPRARAVAVVDPQRAQDAARRPQRARQVRHLSAGKSSRFSEAGGAVSSGRRPMPTRPGPRPVPATR